MDNLRKAAELLEKLDATMVRFPGWDLEYSFDSEKNRAKHIRFAARAIFNSEDFDSSMFAAAFELGYLVQYIADMMEE